MDFNLLKEKLKLSLGEQQEILTVFGLMILMDVEQHFGV